MDDLTLYPEPAQLRRINRELVAYVRRGFPMRFYGRHSEHSAFVAGALLRMCDAVESQMLLMTRRRDTDAQILLRSLYEQMIRIAWVEINPVAHHQNWVGEAKHELLTQHNELAQYRERLLTVAQVQEAKRAPEMPKVEEMTKQADRYWSCQMPGLHARGHLLSFHGLYQGVYRTGSKPTHGSLNTLESHVDLSRGWPTVHESTERLMITYALSAPILGIALVVAARRFNWIDDSVVRRFVDRASAETTRGRERRANA